MNSHEGVSCDQCMKSNFTSNRYKCLICYDFDLCHSCYTKNKASLSSATATKKPETGSKSSAAVAPQPQVIANPTGPSSTHLNTHPMQCILTKADYELHYGNGTGGSVNDYLDQLSFTCPYCGKIGLSEAALSDHLSKTHDDQQTLSEVVCPICAVLSSANGGDPNHLTDDLLHHINLEHLEPFALDENGLREVSGLITNTTASAVAAAAALRFSRRLNTSNSANTNNSNLTNSSSNRVMVNRPISSRYQAFPGGSLSSFMRSTSNVFDALGAAAAAAGSSSSNANDPIAELLSQLAGVRRATNVHASNLHILQSQLSRERGDTQHQSAAAAIAAAAAAAAAANTGTGSGPSSGTGIASYLANSHYSSNLARASNNPLFASSNSNKLKSSNVNNGTSSNNASSGPQQQNASSAGANNIINAMLNQALELPSNLFCQPLPPNSRDSRYLLSKYDFSTIDNQQSTINSKLNPFAQSLFINDVLLSLFINQMSESTSTNSGSSSSSGTTNQPLAPTETSTNEAIIEDLLVDQQYHQQEQQMQPVPETTGSI